MVKKVTTLPKFDETGNIILKKPEPKEPESEPDEFRCHYCGKQWTSKISKDRHESWCEDNPNRRKHHKNPVSEPKNEKKETRAKPRGRPKNLKEKDIIKELREFDKTFGLTDEQIVKYIRGKMRK